MRGLRLYSAAFSGQATAAGIQMPPAHFSAVPPGTRQVP
jgi:hypothetical protein